MFKLKALYAFTCLNVAGFPCCCCDFSSPAPRGDPEVEVRPNLDAFEYNYRRSQDNLQQLRTEMERTSHQAQQLAADLERDRNRLAESTAIIQQAQQQIRSMPSNEWVHMRLKDSFTELLRQHGVPNKCQVIMCNDYDGQSPIQIRYTMSKHGFNFLPGKLDLSPENARDVRSMTRAEIEQITEFDLQTGSVNICPVNRIDFEDLFRSKFYENEFKRNTKYELLFVWGDRYLPVTAKFDDVWKQWDAEFNPVQLVDLSDQFLVEIDRAQELIELAGFPIGQDRYCVRMLDDLSGTDVKIDRKIQGIKPAEQRILIFDSDHRAYSFFLRKYHLPVPRNQYFALPEDKKYLLAPNSTDGLQEVIKIQFNETQGKYSWKMLDRFGSRAKISFEDSKILKDNGVPEGCKVFLCLKQGGNIADLVYTINLHGIDVSSALSYLDRNAAAIDFEKVIKMVFGEDCGDKQRLLFMWEEDKHLVVDVEFDDRIGRWKAKLAVDNPKPKDISSKLLVTIRNYEELIQKAGPCQIGENRFCLRITQFINVYVGRMAEKKPISDILDTTILLFDGANAYLFMIYEDPRVRFDDERYFLLVADEQGRLVRSAKIKFTAINDTEYSWADA